MAHLMQNIPAAIAQNFRIGAFSDQGDVFCWRGSCDGTFQTKQCFDSFQTRYGSIGLGPLIWKPWIPTKVSCFAWKVFHKVVPTDDNILRFGIALASKCNCCRMASQESSQHLLFQGDWAKRIWSYLGTLFDRPHIRGLAAFRHIWLINDSTDFVNMLASALACTALWEIWKSRNCCRHESNPRDSLFTTLNWAPRIARLLKGSYKASFQNDLILQSLRIHKPSRRGRNDIPMQIISLDQRSRSDQAPPLRKADDHQLPRPIRYRYLLPNDDTRM